MTEENDMKSGMMAMLNTMLPEKEEPKNVVAKFVQTELSKVLDESDEAGVISVMLINIANDQPKDVLKTLIEVYNDIGEFVTNLTSISVSGDHEMLENPNFEVIDDTADISSGDTGPEGEPELDDEIDKINKEVDDMTDMEVIESLSPEEFHEVLDSEMDIKEPEPEPEDVSDEDALKKEMAALLEKYKRK